MRAFVLLLLLAWPAAGQDPLETPAVPDRELLRRLDSAELVLVGTVREVREPAGGRKVLGSEHDPLWREAILKVGSLEKGRPESPTVTFLFASSRDVQWAGSPKVREGQEAVWLLRREQKPGLLGRDLVILEPLDVLPLDELERVRRLIRNLP